MGITLGSSPGENRAGRIGGDIPSVATRRLLLLRADARLRYLPIVVDHRDASVADECDRCQRSGRRDRATLSARHPSECSNRQLRSDAAGLNALGTALYALVVRHPWGARSPCAYALRTYGRLLRDPSCHVGSLLGSPFTHGAPSGRTLPSSSLSPSSRCSSSTKSVSCRNILGAGGSSRSSSLAR